MIPGMEMMTVLKSIRSPFSLRTSLKSRARRRTRRTLAPPPVPKAKPMMLITTQKKSNWFHRSAKYNRGPIARSFTVASKMNTAEHPIETPSSATVHVSDCW